MVEQIATVLRADANGFWLTTTPVSSCNSCQVSTDCGTGIVTKSLTPRQHSFFVSTTLQLLPGEQVKIGMAEQRLLQAAAMVYLLPLVLMLLLALTGAAMGLAEGWLMLLALLAIAAFVFWGMYDGVGQIFALAAQSEAVQQLRQQALPDKVHARR